MKKRTPFNIALLFLVILIQSTPFNLISFWGIKPDFVLLFICLVSIREGGIPGTVFGFTGGIIQDLLSNSILGAEAFAKSLWGYLIGKSSQRFDTGSMPVQIGLVFFFSIFEPFLINFFHWLFNYPSFFKKGILFYIPGQGMYNCIVWPIFTYIVTRLEKICRIRQ